MRNLILFVVLLPVLLLPACAKQAEQTTAVGVEFKVDTLFTHNGCTMYRFVDGGSFRYYADCRGETTWVESCGKNCTHTKSIPTSR